MIRLRITAIYEVLAGVLGMAYTLRPQALPNGGAIRFNIFVAILAAASISLGGYLWDGSTRARRLSFAFQLAQVPRIATSLMVFSTLVGVEGSVLFRGPLVSAYTTTGVQFLALIPTVPPEGTLGVNLVALAAAALLWPFRGGAPTSSAPLHVADGHALNDDAMGAGSEG